MAACDIRVGRLKAHPKVGAGQMGDGWWAAGALVGRYGVLLPAANPCHPVCGAPPVLPATPPVPMPRVFLLLGNM